MNYQHKALTDRIDVVCRRWRKLILLKGAAQVLVTVVAAAVFAIALDSIFDLNNSIRLGLLITVGVITLASLYFEIIHPLIKVPSQKQLARYIEEKHPELEDRLVSAVELGSAENPRISTQILEKLLDDARFHIEPINLPKELKSKNAKLWGSLAMIVSIIVLGLIFSNTDFFSVKSNRLFTPWTIQTIKLEPNLRVIPGDTRIPNGSAQEIKAELTGFEAEEVALYFTSNDSIWSKNEMDRTEQNGVFIFNFFDLQNITKYYVKADEHLSEIYTITLYDAPHVKRVDLSYNYPKYTGLKAKKEKDTGDVWAPEGTVVKITAVTDKPLKEGQVVMGPSKNLRTSIRADTLVTASFIVKNDTYYTIHITDNDGLSNEPPPEYFIHALPDQAPVLSLQRPGRDVKATMLEEVPIKIMVQDDYGVNSLKLFYSVNGVNKEPVNLSVKKALNTQREVAFNEVREYSAEHLFYLEELKVQPGDFLAYHVTANDNRGVEAGEPVISEIFFIEIRPFERQYFRPLSQGQMSGTAGARQGGQLSQTQKDIIVATWKLQNRKEKISQDELNKGIEVLIESQKNLQEVTQSTLFQMKQRSIFSRDSGNNAVTKYYTNAIESMEQALTELSNKRLKEAVPPESEAFHNLYSAEVQITDVQMQRAQAQGAGSRAALDELAQLFEDEIDKLKNKYETPRQNQQRQNDEAMNEALNKVKELARRQQQINQKMRDLAQKNLSAEEKKRQIQELRRQQEQMRRETQDLTRDMQNQQQNGNVPREVQDKLRQTTSDMNSASINLRQKNTDMAAAKGQRALNKLKRLEDLLQRNQKESLRRQFDSLRQDFQRLTEAQKELTRDVEELRKVQEDASPKRLEAQKDQNRLKDDFTDTKEKLKLLSQDARKTKNEASRKFSKFSQDLERSNIDKKMESAEQLLKENSLNSALQAERDIKNILERLQDKFTRLGGVLAESEEEKLDLALNQTRKLRENLESIKRQFEENNRAKEEPKQGVTQKQDGQQPKNWQAGPGESRRPPQKLDPSKLDWLNNELAEGIKDLDVIRQSTQSDTSLHRKASRLNQNAKKILRTFTGGDQNRIKIIEDLVLIPLRGFEAELAQKLEIIKNKEKLFLAREEKIPPEYEELVEKYYEALSKSNKK